MFPYTRDEIERMRTESEARDYLARALEIFERLGTLHEPERVTRALAEVG